MLGDASAYLRLLKAASAWPGWLGDAAQMLYLLGLPWVFLVVLGPPANALLLWPLRCGARLVCRSALRDGNGKQEHIA